MHFVAVAEYCIRICERIYFYLALLLRSKAEELKVSNVGHLIAEKSKQHQLSVNDNI